MLGCLRYVFASVWGLCFVVKIGLVCCSWIVFLVVGGLGAVFWLLLFAWFAGLVFWLLVTLIVLLWYDTVLRVCLV